MGLFAYNVGKFSDSAFAPGWESSCKTLSIGCLHLVTSNLFEAQRQVLLSALGELNIRNAMSTFARPSVSYLSKNPISFSCIVKITSTAQMEDSR